jgi:2',3'-cyclic-nucleotide 2'-phosphodiesterase (5'-nucleotidase family)
MTFLKCLSAWIFFLLAFEIHAKVIQILHTNDLHSYFQGTRGGKGGYAQLKSVIDRLKAKALDQGIPTLYLDAGDFGEGSSFYFSDQGVDSMRALDLLGVDVTVLGNHDFILGGKELRQQMKKSQLKAKLLSANLKGKKWLGLKQMVPGHVDWEVEGKKIRIFGLTTNEIHFMYPLRPLGYISDPIRAGIKEAQRAQKDHVDFTIALTHIGLSQDITLVTKSHSIDLVVGGHTHLLLQRPQLTKNLSGRLIPILQAGAHAGYVGRMIIDIKGKGEAELIDYQMVDVTKNMPQNLQMKEFVDLAYSKREKYFGRSWDEVIGVTEIPLTGNVNGQDTQPNTCWSRHIARVTREAAKTDLGLQFDVFQGEMINPGPVTFGDLIDNFPRFRKWGDKGWKVSRARVSGFLLKKILQVLANSELALQVTIDGVSANDHGRIMAYDARTHLPSQARIKGEEISNLRFYTIGLPSEIPFAFLKFLNVFALVILAELETIDHADYWTLLENHIRQNSPLRCLKD